MNQDPEDTPGETDEVRNDDQQPAVPTGLGPIGAPRLSQAHFSRPRLLQLLDANPDAALRIIEAPSGYGKTSLLAEWARQRPHTQDTLWVTVDDFCNTRLGFWAYIIGLLHTTGRARTIGFDGVSVTGGIAAILPVTLLHGFESLRRPLTLIVDSYENISDPAIETDLLRLVRHTTNLHVVIGTRTSSALNSTATALTVDTIVLDAHELTFSREEVEGLAVQVESPLTPEQVNALYQATSGWPLAVRAGIQTAPETHWLSTNEVDQLSRIQRLLLDDLTDMPGFDQLVTASIVDSFTIEQAQLMGAQLDDSPLLVEVESRGLGSWEDDRKSDTRFRLQPLVRDALRTQLSGAQLRATHRRLIDWYEDRHDYAHAFESALIAQDWLEARRHLTHRFHRVWEGLDRNWTRHVDIPRDVLRSHPLLAIVVSLGHYRRGNVAKAIRILTTGVATAERRHLTDHRHVSVDQLFVQAMLTLGLRFAGRDELVQPALRRLRKMLARVNDPRGELHYLQRVFDTQIASTYTNLDRNDDAARALLDPPAVREITGSHDFYAESLNVLIHASAGRITQARAILAKLLNLVLPRDFNLSFYSVPKHIGAAYIHLEDHRPDAAEEELSHVDPHWSTMEMWQLFLHARTLQQWQSAGPEAALRNLESGLAEKKHAPLGAAMNAMLTALRAELLLATNHSAEARQLFPARKTGHYPRLAVAKARGFLLEGDLTRALTLTTAPEHETRTTPRDQLHMRLIAASAQLRSGDTTNATRSFTDATNLAARTGLLSPFAAMPRQDFTELANATPGCDELGRDIEQFPIMFPDPEELVSLTKRELIVLAELATTATLPVIAVRLSVATSTIKSQCRAIYRKLGVSGRDEAVTQARRRGLI